MIKRQVTRGLVLLMLIGSFVALQGPGCVPPTAVVETVEVTRVVTVTPEVTVLPIPLGLSPSTAILNPGDQVVISVISEEWQAAELTWELFSDSEDLRSPDALSASTGPSITYTAPEGLGEVTISVRGLTEQALGSASVSFAILPRPRERITEFWTFPPNVDWDSERASEFPGEYPGVWVKTVFLSPLDTRDKLWTAISVGVAPDTVRFPGTDDVQAFGEKGLLDANAATRIIHNIGLNQFDPEALSALLDPADKTRWLAIPSEQGALGIMIGAAHKGVAEAWVLFLVERELQ